MIIDAHVHIWHRNWLPDQAVKLYLEPARKLKEFGLDDVFDFGLDDEIPFSDYDTPMDEYVRGLDANRIDRMIVLGIDFGLVNEGRMTIDEYFQWLYDKCSVDDRFMIFIGVDPNRKDVWWAVRVLTCISQNKFGGISRFATLALNGFSPRLFDIVAAPPPPKCR